ncbi:nucleotidyl transferase AbiEii/AbiGii toxin family protein [Mycoplasma zalophidermidis]|uniref:Nucleotidyl transferase AbiEii/AbiGii toxin family protein n=2 Tax=Mycoplasma zalophidermidis TaxID=398174 RepID=A0ABS6DSF6_9MOLU|nr:nucleotidyl transferase AbiEii/AbiGii toxin family protein [Mycoplasma zalophidermidis]MBU4693954.1 nucleotidyl transferase AbiEii/AbiGii toxin family protein [Mycoplasma zalophidermidis]
MITSSRQLKDKINNLTGGDSKKSQVYLRNLFMERFLERVSRSDYKNNLIVKGGILVASLVGLDTRATMDIDTTVKSLTLSETEARNIVENIMSVDLADGVTFKMVNSALIMEEHDYPGIRFSIDGYFEKIRQAIKIDLSTGDAITPRAIEYKYFLMFEDRYISLLTYNIETLLAEKLETMIARSTANTRMRDFYDIFLITGGNDYSIEVLHEAVIKTATKRGTLDVLKDYKQILVDVKESEIMRKAWTNFEKQSFFVKDTNWDKVIDSCINLADEVFNN